MYKFFFLLIFSLFSLYVFAGINVHIGIVQKKGIDKGLVLVSEFLAVEDLLGRGEQIFKTSSGVSLKLFGKFILDEKTYGPSTLILFSGKLINKDGKILFSFANEVNVGNALDLKFPNVADQLTEISITPVIEE